MAELMAERTDTAHRVAGRTAELRGTSIVVDEFTLHAVTGRHYTTVRPDGSGGCTLRLVMAGVIDEHIIQTSVVIRVVLRHVHALFGNHITCMHYHLRMVTIVVRLGIIQRDRSVTVKLRAEDTIRAGDEIIAGRTHTAVFAVTRLVQHLLEILLFVLELDVAEVDQDDDTFRRTAQRIGSQPHVPVSVLAHHKRGRSGADSRFVFRPKTLVIQADGRTVLADVIVMKLITHQS